MPASSDALPTQGLVSDIVQDCLECFSADRRNRVVPTIPCPSLKRIEIVIATVVERKGAPTFHVGMDEEVPDAFKGSSSSAAASPPESAGKLSFKRGHAWAVLPKLFEGVDFPATRKPATRVAQPLSRMYVIESGVHHHSTLLCNVLLLHKTVRYFTCYKSLTKVLQHLSTVERVWDSFHL